MAQGAQSAFGVLPWPIWGRGAGYWGAVHLMGMCRRALKSFCGFCCVVFFFLPNHFKFGNAKQLLSVFAYLSFFFFFVTLFGRKMKLKLGSAKPPAVQLASGRTVQGRAASSRAEFGGNGAVLGDFSIRCCDLCMMGKPRHGFRAPSHPEPSAVGTWGQGSVCAEGIWGSISDLEGLEAAWNRVTGRDFVQK